MKYISSDLSRRVLTIGPDYHDHRGGIGAVLETYNDFFEKFNFIPSFRPFESNIRKIFYFFRQLGKIVAYLIKNKNIGIVHIHGSHGASLYRKFVVFLVSKYLFNKKVIYHVHSSSYDVVFKKAGGLQKKVINKLINNSDLIICLSIYWKFFFEENFNAKQIVIINNVVNAPVDIKKNTLENDGPVNFLFLGRIGDRKGIFDLLDIVTTNNPALNNRFKLYVGGDGEIERLESYIKKNNLTNLVEYVGWVTDQKKASLFKAADVYILPSYNEGLPISILEAMSYGLPVISTNVGGIPEILENNVNGFIFEPGDKKTMENAIFALLNDRAKIAEFGDGSLKKIKPYLPQHVAQQLTACYHNLLSNTHE